jgi:hypothetical protein
VCQEIASRRGHECFFDADGNLVIRHDVTDDNDDSIPGEGPDIGTVANPVAIISDGDGGNMVGLTATLSRQGACNGVRINLHSTVPKKVRKKTDRDTADDVDWHTAPISAHVEVLQETGPVAWGGKFGKLPIVIERDVKDLKKWSAGGSETWSDTQADAYADAKRILHRRRGVIRFLDIHALPMPWLEPDDKVRVRWREHEDDDDDYNVVHEAHFVSRVELSLDGSSPMVIRTRQLSVVDPGG